MNKKGIIFGAFLTIILSVLIFYMGLTEGKAIKNSVTLFQVYLNGKRVGLMNSADELYNLIDFEQKEIKEKYGVDKVYPPEGLEITPIKTYETSTMSAEMIYNLIKDEAPFTVEGYAVTIKDDDDTTENIRFNILNREDLDTAIRNTVLSFVNTEDLEKYIAGTQEEITDTGETIDDLYLKEEVRIKEAFISTEDKIFTDPDELSRYMLFGSLEADKEYTVALGDDIKTVATNNMLSVNEFLIANPNIVSENALLSVGQKVNISLIDPLVSVVTETTSVEKQDIAYETDVEYDVRLSASTRYVKQEGSNGLTKVTYKNEIVNGVLYSTVQLSKEEITPVINRILVVGGFNTVYVGDSTYWAWPTNKPYKISSVFGPRWGSWHYGIDITGTGYGSPIYAIQSGTVVRSSYGGDMGNYVIITHNNGYNSVYMHMSERIASEGDAVIKGQIIGLMGSTGRSTGTHLHLGIYTGSSSYSNSRMIDPLLIYQ